LLLPFEIVYKVLSADYNLHMDIQEEVLSEIISAFKKKGIDFAIPAQRLYKNEEKDVTRRNSVEEEL
jgi:small-conductance mechanosensitive channel